MTYKVGYTDWIQVGGVFCVSQIGQSGAELVVKTLSTVVVPLQVEQVSDRMNSCDKTQRRHVTAALCSFVFVCKKKKKVWKVFLTSWSKETVQAFWVSNICSRSFEKRFLLSYVLSHFPVTCLAKINSRSLHITCWLVVCVVCVAAWLREGREKN